MDEAFIGFAHAIRGLLAIDADFVDDAAGVHTYVSALEIESPVELDVTRDEHGSLTLGTSPPLYYIDTSIRPSFHRVRFRAERMVNRAE